MKHHPIATVWPMFDDAKLDELADDIREHGQLHPIWIFEGMILDGRNRFEACRRAGVKPVVMEYKGDEPTAFAVSLNDRRRHMGKSSRRTRSGATSRPSVDRRNLWKKFH
jgi:hypothetical protein